MKKIYILVIFLALIVGCTNPSVNKEEDLSEDIVSCDENTKCYWRNNPESIYLGVQCVNERYGDPNLWITDNSCECDLKINKCVSKGALPSKF